MSDKPCSPKDVARAQELLARGDAASARRFVKRATYARLNKRRAELIYKRHPDGLTAEEEKEYELLQQLTLDLINLAYPYNPHLFGPELDEILKRLKAEHPEKFDGESE